VKKEESISKECVNLLNDTSRKMTNPLLQKYEELYGKKEPPKMPRIEDYEGEETFADELKKSNFIKAKNPKTSLKTYDPDSVNVSFQQIAEKVKNGEAQVSSMSIERDIMSETKITFEVMVYEP
jgi:hypothetical protein